MKNLRQLIPYLKPYRARLIMALAGTALFNVLALSPPLIFRFIVDEVVKLERWDLFAPAILVYGILPLVFHCINFGNVLNIVFIGTRLVSDVRQAMYQLLLRLSMRYHGRTSTGALITRLMGDVNTVQELVAGQTIQLFGDIIVFLFSVGVAFSIHPLLASILIGVIVLYVLVYRFFAARIHAATRSMRSATDTVFARLQETLDGVRQVRIYNREDDERMMFLDRSSTVLAHGLESGMNTVGLSATCSVVAGYGSTVIYALAAYYVLESDMSLGDLLALNTYVWMALHPALRLTMFAGHFAQISVSLDRIFEVMHEERDVVSPSEAPVLRRGGGRVEFRDVHFAYDEEKPLFHGLNLVARAGTMTALVGHTGCGKTTVTSLLMRMWDVQKGQILIDGTDISTVRLNSLRDLFGVVPQNPVIFEGTVADNIAYGKPDAAASEIQAAARAAEVKEFAERLPEGLNTLLGTYGVKLSLGQKQRISIARSILKDPLILVMDEATSALDSESEALIQKALSNVLKGRTAFVVAHRLSTIMGADTIIVMDSGRIVEQGTHDELMRIPHGVYRALYGKLRRAEREDTR